MLRFFARIEKNYAGLETKAKERGALGRATGRQERAHPGNEEFCFKNGLLEIGIGPGVFEKAVLVTSHSVGGDQYYWQRPRRTGFEETAELDTVDRVVLPFGVGKGNIKKHQIDTSGFYFMQDKRHILRDNA